MSKSVEAFRTIAEVADDLAVPKHVLRFWEVKFPQIRPMKRGGGRRYYRPEDLELLRGIQALLHAEAYTIKGVQKILREQGVDHVKQFGREPLSIPGNAAAGKRKRTATEAPGRGAPPSDRGHTMNSAPTARTAPAATVAAALGAMSPRTGASVAARGGAASARQNLQAILTELEACRALLQSERQQQVDGAAVATGRVRAGR